MQSNDRRHSTLSRPAGSPRWLLASSALLLIAWSFAVPVFEAPDEPAHWQYARWLHDERTLPRYDARFVEANQPPLYYLLIAPFAVAGPMPAAAARFDGQGNLRPEAPPRFYRGTSGDLGRYWPLRVSRLVTCAISLLTVYFTYLGGVAATGSRTTGLLAGAITAFLPQFTFRGTNVSNDALVAMVCSAAVYLLVRLIRGGFTPRIGLAIGAVMALAVLSKLNAIAWPIVFASAILSEPCSWSRRIGRLWVLAVATVLVAPWLVRNVLLYGDLLATNVMWEAVPDLVVPRSITSPYFLNQFPTELTRSFVGMFGWMNVAMPEPLYRAYAAFAVLGAVGCVWCLVSRPAHRRLLAVLSSAPALALALVVHLNLTFSQPQGRYLFPALTAIALSFALGVEALPRWNPRSTLVVVVGLAAMNVWALSSLVASYPAVPDDVEQAEVAIPTGHSNAALRQLFKYYRFRVETPPTGVGRTAGPLRPGIAYAQSFVAEQDNLTRVELEFASYVPNLDSGSFEMHLRSTLTDASDIASLSVPLRALNTRSFVGPSFAPIPSSRGKTYYVVFELPEGCPPLTVWQRDGETRAQTSFFVAGRATSESASFQAVYASGAASP